MSDKSQSPSCTEKLADAKVPWTKEEDEQLKAAVEKHGACNWNDIAALLPGRSPKSCRLRWHNHLCPGISKAPFSQWEDALIRQAVRRDGTKWSSIARLLPNRTDNAIKNRWNCTISRKERKGILQNKYISANRSVEDLLAMKRSRPPTDATTTSRRRRSSSKSEKTTEFRRRSPSRLQNKSRPSNATGQLACRQAGGSQDLFQPTAANNSSVVPAEARRPSIFSIEDEAFLAEASCLANASYYPILQEGRPAVNCGPTPSTVRHQSIGSEADDVFAFVTEGCNRFGHGGSASFDIAAAGHALDLEGEASELPRRRHHAAASCLRPPGHVDHSRSMAAPYFPGAPSTAPQKRNLAPQVPASLAHLVQDSFPSVRHLNPPEDFFNYRLHFIWFFLHRTGDPLQPSSR